MTKNERKSFYLKHGIKERGDSAKQSLIRAVPLKSYHAVPFTNSNEISVVYPAIDNELAIENIESDMDMTAADLQDFKK